MNGVEEEAHLDFKADDFREISKMYAREMRLITAETFRLAPKEILTNFHCSRGNWTI